DRLTDATVPGGPTHIYFPLYGNIAYTFPIAWAHRPGIVRDVSLVYSNHAVVTGVFAEQTYNADLSSMNLHVRVRAKGDVASNMAALVGVTLLGSNQGGCLAQAAGPDELACTITMHAPSLWSPDTPVMNDLWITLFDPSGLADAIRESMGFRKIEARTN